MHTHTYLQKLRSHTRMHTHPERDGTRADRYQTYIQRQRFYKAEAQTHMHILRYTDRHAEKRDTNPKIHGEADRRIHKQRYSDTSTRRGVHRHPRQQQTLRGPDVRLHPEIQSCRGGISHRDTQTEDNRNTTRTRYTQPRARTPRETHTHSAWGRVQCRRK